MGADLHACWLRCLKPCWRWRIPNTRAWAWPSSAARCAAPRGMPGVRPEVGRTRSDRVGARGSGGTAHRSVDGRRDRCRPHQRLRLLYPFADLAVHTWAKRLTAGRSWPETEAEFARVWARLAGDQLSAWTLLTLAWGVRHAHGTARLETSDGNRRQQPWPAPDYADPTKLITPSQWRQGSVLAVG